MSTCYLTNVKTHRVATTTASQINNATDKQFDLIKASYNFKGSENKLKKFIFSHELADFLAWINQPITDIFGNINRTLHLFKCWDEEDYHLVLSIFSELDDMDEISDKESKLFQSISINKKDNFLDYVVIVQR